ncbi:MAG: TIGR02281 family clan AA aspartic protease [Rhodobacterales bacterium]|nr:TIGR02281 family clan AA aspartic protease [Rhodobacterales bacterium]MDX5390849.1 TIGR02281 family clan AA aspartic protease [Rhodobacterales bacterium]MDX5490544.1 TIGR02281 family clan AA aspartic protease [Rhodobacterales bacterium]
MDGNDLGRLTYLILLGAVIVFWFVAQNRQSLGKTMQQALVWGLLFLGVIAAFGLWSDIRQTVRPAQSVMTAEGRIELPRAPDGHYYMTVQVNGADIRFLVDTGASDIYLSRQDAERAGLDPANLAFIGSAMTANGPVRTAPVRLDSIRLGGIEDRGLRAFVNEGEMRESLLGMTYLQRFSSVEIRQGALILTR